MMSVWTACRVVFRPRAYRYLALAVFLLALGLYLFTLPATFTGGVIGLVSLRYLNVELIVFSVTLALLLSVVITLNLYGFHTSLRRQGAGLSVGAVVSSLVPSGLCCTSLLPSALAALGASTPEVFGLTGRIQGTIARYEVVFLFVAVFLLLASLWLAVTAIQGSCALDERMVSSGEPGE